MAKSIREIFKHCIFLLVYPISSVIGNPLSLAKTLWNIRLLFTKSWRDYNAFSPYEGLNHFFYKTRALNLKKYGRYGKSSFIALGDFKLNRMFHYTLPSLYLHYWSSNFTTIIGLLIFIISFVIIPTSANWIFQISLLLIFLFSSSFNFQLKNQNYNILGWMLFPTLLFAIDSGELLLIGGLMLALTLFSFTAWVVACLLLLPYLLLNQWWILIFYLIPSVISIGLLFVPIIKDPNGGAVLVKVAKAIGLRKQNVKYRRSNNKTLEWKFTRAYELFLYCLFGLATFYFTYDIPTFYYVLIGLYLLNHSIMRFMDIQSVNILFVSGILYISFTYNIPLLLVFTWLALNPLPITHNLKSQHPLKLKSLKPFNYTAIYNDLDSFLSLVPRNSKVLLSYADPGTSYDKVFDGFRNLIELPHFIANHKEIHLLPDWWSVFEVNYEGAPDFWGRSKTEVLEKMNEWDTDYVIVYEKEEENLNITQWKSDFEILSKFDWNSYKNLKDDIRLRRPGFPKWFLLKRK